MSGAPVSQTPLASGVYDTPAEQRVISGGGRIDAIAAELEARGCTRAFVITGASLARKTPLLERLKAVLGERFAGASVEIGAHAPLADVAAAASAAMDARADSLVSLGGGSVIDATKCVGFALSQGLHDAPALAARLGHPIDDASVADLPFHAAVPTTASAAEFTGLAGVLLRDEVRKAPLAHRRLAPRVVVHDPAVTLHTPDELWLSTAIRSLDHAVEAYYGPNRNAYTDALAEKAVELFFQALPACRQEPEDLGHRALVQSATWLAGYAALGAGTALSHGIGYLLGARYEIPHGICSCLTLPAVMAWNREASIASQARVARAAAVAPAGASIADAAALAAPAVGRLIAGLGLPTRLSTVLDLTIDARRQLAEDILTLPHLAANPRKPIAPADTLELVETIYGC